MSVPDGIVPDGTSCDETDPGEPGDEARQPARTSAIVLRALLYAGIITLVVLFAGEELPRFIYMEF